MPDTYPITVSGPFGQYTVEAVVDPDATFSRVPTPALIEMGIEPVRVVRVKGGDSQAQFRQLGRALTTRRGARDVTPVLFGDAGQPAVIGATTLSILLLRWEAGSCQMAPIEALRARTRLEVSRIEEDDMSEATTELIDFHTHIRPPWWEGATNPATAGLSPGSEDRVARMIDIDRMVDESRAAGIAHRALSAGVEGVYGAHGNVSSADVRRINEFTAESISKAPDMFYGLATIDASAGDSAAREAEYAVRELGLHGLFLDAQRQGVYPGSPQARPTLATAAELGVPVFIHPVWAPDDDAFRAAGGSAGGSFGRGVTQGLAALSLLHSGVFEEFPNLDILITAYGTGAVIFAADAIAAYAKAHGVTPRLHIDTLTFHPPTIRYVTDALGADRVVLGSDWPIRLDAYAPTINAAFDAASLTPEERALVGSGNARRLLRLGS